MTQTLTVHDVLVHKYLVVILFTFAERCSQRTDRERTTRKIELHSSGALHTIVNIFTVHDINESGRTVPHHKSSSSSSLCKCELCDRVQSSRLEDRSGVRSPRVVSGRPRAAGCASPAPRRGVQGLIYEQEVCQASTHAPLYVYLLREEGRRRVRVEVPREEAVDKLGL